MRHCSDGHGRGGLGCCCSGVVLLLLSLSAWDLIGEVNLQKGAADVTIQSSPERTETKGVWVHHGGRTTAAFAPDGPAPFRLLAFRAAPSWVGDRARLLFCTARSSSDYSSRSFQHFYGQGLPGKRRVSRGARHVRPLATLCSPSESNKLTRHSTTILINRSNSQCATVPCAPNSWDWSQRAAHIELTLRDHKLSPVHGTHTIECRLGFTAQLTHTQCRIGGARPCGAQELSQKKHTLPTGEPSNKSTVSCSRPAAAMLRTPAPQR